MATFVPPKRGVALTFYVSLVDRAARPQLKANPTLAAGDVKVSKDGGAFANLTTLPAATPAAGVAIKVDLSAAEMTADQVVVTFQDAAGAEWDDLAINIATAARQIDDLAFPNVSGRGQDVTATGEVESEAVSVRAAVGLAAANLDTQLGAIAGFIDTEVAAILAAVDTEVAAIKAKTDNLPVNPAAQTNLDVAVSSRAAPGAAMALTPGERDSAAAALLDLANAIEAGLTLRGYLRLAAAVMAGKVSGAGSGTEVFRNAVADTKARVTATVDASGNRTAIVADVT